jgi:hypothetical protein
VRPAQKPQESFRRFALNNQSLESYEYDQCYRAKHSRLLAEVVECFGEIFQTPRRLRLRFGKPVHFKSGNTQGNGKQSDVIPRNCGWHSRRRLSVSAGPKKFSRSSRGDIPSGVPPTATRTATNIHTMSTILEVLVEHPQTSLGKAENRTADSRTLTNHQAGPEKGNSPTPAWLGFGNAPTQSSGHDRPLASFRFAPFKGRFEGLRIPSSPLHEF